MSLTPEQQQCVEHLDGPLLISAGAGSGKTFTLTQRIMHAMQPGSGEGGSAFLGSIDDVLVITYTRKAAGELKDRIRSALRQAGMTAEALKVDTAWISTFHGMCERILREHALEIGMDPQFSVIGETDEESLRTTAINTVLACMQQDPEHPYRALFDVFSVEQVDSFVTTILKNTATLPRGIESLELGPEAQPLQALARTLFEFSQDIPPDATDAARTILEGLQAGLGDYLQQESDDPQALQEALAVVKLGSITAKKYPDLHAAVLQARAILATGPLRAHAALLAQLCRDVEALRQQLLRERGQLDLAGLIRRTLQTFDDYPAIAALYTDRFKLIMVDEFQDTSQLQVNMIERMAGQGRQRLCSVGDAQQSIYSFQGADVSVYLQHKRDMCAGGAHTVQLGTNFRSHADVLAFVRTLCGQQGYFPEKFLDLQAGSAGGTFRGSGPRIEVALAAHGRGEKAQAIAAEAQYFARRFAELRAAGHEANEMVILMRTVSSAAVYAHALRAEGFDCVITGGSDFYKGAHVQMCLRLLDVLANPYNSESLLSVLTGEALPVTTDDLLRAATHERQAKDGTVVQQSQNLAKAFLSPEGAPAQTSKLFAHAREVLLHAWSKLGQVRPAQLLEETLLESGWLARLEAQGPEGLVKAADVVKFIRLVDETQGEVGFDMTRVAAHMHSLADSTKEQPGTLVLENANAVRIMTIHKSKGLEFPIVAVAMHDSGGRDSSLKTHTANQRLHVALVGKAEPLKPYLGATLDSAENLAEYAAAILTGRKQQEYEEMKRLLYVACTRAKAALLLGVRTSWSKSGGYGFDLVPDVLRALFPGEDDFPTGVTRVDYGGSQPLRFERLVLPDAQDRPADAGAVDAGSAEQTIRFGSVVRQAPLSVVPYPVRSDFFSYSSLHAARIEDGQRGAADGAGDAAENVAENATENVAERTPVPAFSRRAGAAESAVGPAPDADKATVFGSALHRVCEVFALQHQGWQPQGHVPSASDGLQPSTPSALGAPPETSEHLLARVAAEFGVQDIERLRAAFARWQSSEACAWAFGFDTVSPELPFVLAIDGRVMEGEIDLFCTRGKQAGIIDYKTGGTPSETPSALHDKHLLQAQCYAYAALNAGFEEVEARFVRVEQAAAQDPTQPQVVAYAFSQADRGALLSAIRCVLSPI